MLRVRRARPILENLEGRYAPATIKLIGGNLFISNPASGTLTVTATGTNTFKVDDGGKVVSGLKAGSGVFITGSNKADIITFDLAANKFTGNLLINAMNGNDQVDINGTGAATIGGNVTLLSGLGDDIVNTNGKLRIGGNFTAVDTAGTDELDIFNDGQDDVVGGNLTAFGYNDITIGGDNDLIGGSVNLSTPSDGKVVSIVIADGLLIGGSLSVLSGNQNDSFNYGGATLGGNLSVNLSGGATNGINLGSGGVAGTIAGNATVGSAGTAGTVVASSGVNVAGNLTVNMGNGNYTVILSVASSVAGSLFLNTGNGNSTMKLNAAVSGNLNVTTGNGNNTVLVATLGGSAPGGTFNFTGGNGVTTMTLGAGPGSGSFNVNIRFGSGNDSLTVSADSLTGFIDFDGDDGTGDTFDPMATTLSPNLVIQGLP